MPDEMIRVTIYSRPGCHLCDDMKGVVLKVIERRADVSVDEVDISTDPALGSLYGLDIPVLAIDGRKAAKHRISEADFARLLDRPRR
jgi:glutaredoxin